MKKRITGFIVSLVLIGAAMPAAFAAADTSGPLDHVVLTPAIATVEVGEGQQFTAVGQDSNNVTADNVSYNWSVVAGGGTINATGFFTAGNVSGTFNNTVQVTAVSGNIVATANATVIVTIPGPGPLDHVVLTPAVVTLPAGGHQQFTAVGQDSNNATADNVSYNWSVVAGGGTINGTGFFTAGNVSGTFNNTVQVMAVSGNVTKIAYATVTVTVTGNETVPFAPPGFEKGEKKGWQGGDTPPGWDKGDKKGWQGGDTPPGLAKGTPSGLAGTDPPGLAQGNNPGHGRKK